MKRIVGLVLACVLLLALFSCNKKYEVENSNVTIIGDTTTVETEGVDVTTAGDTTTAEDTTTSGDTTNADETTSSVITEPHIHVYSTSTTKAPTCTAIGKKEKVCSCGEKITETVNALGHSILNGKCIRCDYKLPVSSKSLEFVLNDDKQSYSVIGIGTYDEDTAVVIPSTYNNLPVTRIRHSAFSGCKNLTLVTMPNSVTEIGKSAFYGCTSLTSVIFKNTVGWKANDTPIQSLDLANKSTAATYLTSTYYTYVFHISVATAKVLDCGKCGENLTWTLYDDGLLKISGTGRSYDYCKGLFGDDVTRAEIEQYQSNYEGLTDANSVAKYERGFQEGKVYDDANGQYIAPWYKYRSEPFISSDGQKILNVDGTQYAAMSDYVKDNPNGYTYNRIEIDEGVTYIGNWFFYRVCGPTELILPETVKEIGMWSIRFSPTLKHVYLPDSLTSIEKYGCSRLDVVEEIRMGTGLTTIGYSAFGQNNLLKRLVVNSNITSDDKYIFAYNKSLEYVEFTALESVKNVHFVDCFNLKEVVFSDDLKSIKTTAFVNRKALEKVNIPVNVTEIDTSAFYGCENLATVYIDSKTVAKGLNYHNSFGAVVQYATTVYIKNDVIEVGKWLTDNFTKGEEINGYITYTKN